MELFFPETFKLLFFKGDISWKSDFSWFKCYNQLPGASTNPENLKKNNPVFIYFFGKTSYASLWK